MLLDDFEKLVLARRATRHFKPDPIPEELLLRLLDISRWAPSGYNLQPTHITVVNDAALKKALKRACMDQAQVEEAPVTMVFSGDKRVYENNFEKVLACERAIGSIDEGYERLLRRIVPLAFDKGLLGLGLLWKALLPPFARLFVPIPDIPAVNKRYWLAKQTLLRAMIFMLAAQAAGLSTVPMEGFDERRVRRVLKIPSTHLVTLVMPVGYSACGPLKKSRLPLKDSLHFNQW
ncbi:MAG: nitroreductase family protein [Acidobacteriota bacterium]|nr:nitroreductase family protein [Blastocatellia bacterium]MDW8413240.1 nitroreductase family protein [Acidobacteriota bacterium]